MAFLRPRVPMRLTRSLRPSPPRFPLDIHPLARLEDGRLELLTAAFPPLGPVRLVLWCPGEEPAFALVAGRIAQGWEWRGGPAEGWVVLWVAEEDPTVPF